MSLASFCSRRVLLNHTFTRSFKNLAAQRPVPAPTETVSSPQAFLAAIGRSVESKLTLETWEELWTKSGYDLKKAGLGVKDRKYILWCMSKYRQGEPIRNFAHENKPKKSVRGWGPKVQNGKRIRSKRIKN